MEDEWSNRLIAKVRTRSIVLVFGGLLAARILGLISAYFLEEDEVSLAIGAAALVADTSGHVYRYTVQAGYYRLIESLDLVLGANISLIPWVMKGISALAGAWLPLTGLFAFRRELTLQQRWLLVGVLAINPIVWRSSQYGNTAMLATTLAATGLVMLSNRPGGRGIAGALALVGAGVLVRADTVLLLPAVFVLLYVAAGRAAAIRTSAVFGAVMALVYAGIFLFDPRVDSASESVSSHMLSTPMPTMFWEFLLWAISPAACVFAIWGARGLLDRKDRLLWLLLVWAVPTLLFYFRATTTCRYFLNVTIPVSIATAVGIDDMLSRARMWTTWRFGPLMARVCVIGVAVVHLFVALGRTSPTQPAEIFYGGTFSTHDGPMPTGALLARTYLTPGSLARNLPRPGFGNREEPFWEGVSFGRAVAALADPAAPKRNVVILLSGGFAHAFHFHAHAAGARYDVGPTGGPMWGSELRFQIGNARVMSISRDMKGFAGLMRINVEADDLVWMVDSGPDAKTLAKMPPGLTLEPTPSFDPHFRTFRVTVAKSTGR